MRHIYFILKQKLMNLSLIRFFANGYRIVQKDQNMNGGVIFYKNEKIPVSKYR